MPFQSLDVLVLFFINKTLANPFFDLIMPLTHMLPYIFWMLLILFFFFRKSDHKLALLMIVAVVINVILVSVIKTTVERERPYQVLDVRQLVGEENDRSFPSNHTQLSFLLSAIVFRFYRRFGLVLFLMSSVIGFGRIYLGVHYPTDVVAGAIMGILLAVLILKFRHRIYKL